MTYDVVCAIIYDMKATLDTNVVFAGLYSRLGASHAILNALAHEEFTLALSVPLFLEYEEVLKRPENLARLGLTVADVDTILTWLAHVAEPVERIYFLWRTLLRDEDDGIVLECAVASASDALVTLNMRHFETVRGLFALDIMLPREFLRRVRGG